MSDPVRITNPGAESLGYDSDGHEIMAVDIYVNPPRVDVFHGTPPAWSSFGNKTIWGGNCHERCNSDPHPTPEIRSRG